MRIAAKRVLLDHVGWTELAEALSWAASVIAGPAVEEYPHPDPADRDAWQAMRCREQRRSCHCQWCTWEKRNRGVVENWRLSQEHYRLAPRHPAAFGSAADALSRWASWRSSGYTEGSALAGTLSRLEHHAELGMTPQSGRVAKDSRAVHEAGLSVDVERALVHAYQSEQARQGFPTWSAIAVLCASTGDTWTADGQAEMMGVPTASVRACVRMGRRAVTVELAARDMIPEPSKPVGLVREVRARRVELEG